MRVIIAGSRYINDYSEVVAAMRDCGFAATEVVCGMARGVDLLGWTWAQERGLPCRQFPADWAKHGKAAGPIRNREMAKNADALVAVWDGKSRGTADMIRAAREMGLKVFVRKGR